jgi:5-formyltetrahydrofolate cyclo-ligase
MDPQAAKSRVHAKARVRAEALAKRDAFSAAEVAARSAVICARLNALPAVAEAAVLCGYAAIRGEVSVEAVLRAALAAGHTVALPRVVPGKLELLLHAVTDLAALVPGPYSIPEPPADAPIIDPADVSVFLVPGVAFDAHGGRLGYGAGYYDRLLHLTRALRIGVAHGFQVCPSLPTGPHDIHMDLVVTEERVIDCTTIFR